MKKNIALAVTAVLLIDAYCANHRARKNIAKMSDVTRYLAKKIDESDVRFDEFDRIAIMSITD